MKGRICNLWSPRALLVIVLIGLCIWFQPIPQVKVEANTILSVGERTTPPSFEIVSISDIPAYGIIEPSGCGEFKGRVKVRFDMFMTLDAPYYEKHHIYTVDWDSPEVMAGYPGEVDEKTGEPLNWEDYQKWFDALPHIWVNNPFHSHFAYFDTSVADEEIKAKIAGITEYFYAFHKYCWENDKQFINEWKKVPIQSGTVREPFYIGTESETGCITKAADIISRADMFDTQTYQKGAGTPTDLNIGEKGTIDVGSPAIDRGSAAYLYTSGSYYTYVEGANPANADGEIDTVEAWFYAAASGNSVKYGTFEHLGSNELKCHDAEEYGEVSTGSKQTCTGLSITISSGEYIGADARAEATLGIERDYTGGTSAWWISGQYCDPNDQGTFTWNAGIILSLYGTGTEGGCSPSIELSQSSWNVNGGSPISEDSTYNTGLTWCTITNNSGGAVTITIGGTDMTGGGYTWDLSDDASNGDMIYGMHAGLSGGSYNIVVRETAPYNTLKAGLGDGGTQAFGLQLYTPTNFDDGNAKSGTVTLTATCD